MYIRAVLCHVRVHFLSGMRGCRRARGSWMSQFFGWQRMRTPRFFRVCVALCACTSVRRCDMSVYTFCQVCADAHAHAVRGCHNFGMRRAGHVHGTDEPKVPRHVKFWSVACVRDGRVQAWYTHVRRAKCAQHEPSARRHPRIAGRILMTCDFCHVPRQRMRTAFNFLLRTDAASAYMRYRIRVPNNLHLLTALLKACILKFARTTSL